MKAARRSKRKVQNVVSEPSPRETSTFPGRVRSLRRFLRASLGAATLDAATLGAAILGTLGACDDGGDTARALAAAGEMTLDAGLGGLPSGGQATGGQGGASGSGGAGPTWDAGDGGTTGGAGGAGGTEPPEPPEFVNETLFQGTTMLRAGVSDDLDFRVPADAVGLSIFALGEPDSVYVVEHLEDPTGDAIVTDDPPGGLRPEDQFISPWPGQFRSPNRATHNQAMATLLVPNNPAVTLMPGLWRLRVAGADPGSGRGESGMVEVTIRVKRAAAPPKAGVLELNLYFTGARGWTAATAPSDPDFLATLFRMGGFYGEVGVEVKAVSFHDIDASFRVIDSFQGEPNNELSRLFAEGTTEEGVNLFFVERFGGRLGAGIGGIAGAIPGPSGPGLGGTSRSGVCVATSVDPDPRGIGHIMGHETGHYLGLFHTSEMGVPVDDLIPDTRTGQAGDENLMFPTVTTAPAHISVQQGAVVRGNPTLAPKNPGENR